MHSAPPKLRVPHVVLIPSSFPRRRLRLFAAFPHSDLFRILHPPQCCYGGRADFGSSARAARLFVLFVSFCKNPSRRGGIGVHPWLKSFSRPPPVSSSLTYLTHLTHLTNLMLRTYMECLRMAHPPAKILPKN